MHTLLAVTLQMLLVASAEDFLMDAGRSNVPIRLRGDTWQLKVPQEHQGTIELRYVEQPESVQLLSTGQDLNFTYEAGTVVIALAKLNENAESICLDVKWPPSKWQNTMDLFEQQDREQPPPARAMLFTGSSTIRIWDLKKSFPNMPVLNRGFGGSEYIDLLRFADRLIFPYNPGKIVIYSGDNDMATGKSAEWVSADATSLVLHIRQRLPKTPIIIIGIKPSIARWNLYPEMQRANARIAAFAKTAANVHFADPGTVFLNDAGKPDPACFIKDGLHLNDKGYEKLSSLLKLLLEEK